MDRKSIRSGNTDSQTDKASLGTQVSSNPDFEPNGLATKPRLTAFGVHEFPSYISRVHDAMTEFVELN